ncbi:DUF4231 domain-containing protein [Nocardia sp. NPDC050435]|uniref:DUF4231 domain-containing protein n=1 Tax=Nocardia sp. NPDC050435 TaxID=3155040 RepID=UPI0033CD797D
MATGLHDEDLPGFWHDADLASTSAQRMYLRLTRIRLIGTIAAAIGGALSWSLGFVDLWGVFAMAGFCAALTAEMALTLLHPERDWYAARALAESCKTLAWRYAVGAEPFRIEVNSVAAHAVMAGRLYDLSRQAGGAIAIGGTATAVVTSGMETLRGSAFDDRKGAYIEQRTRAQQSWYAEKASVARRSAKFWRVLLVIAELIGLIAATLRTVGAIRFDLLGIIAALVGAGSAWLAVRQHSAKAAAYSTAANELAIQVGRLADTVESGWSEAVNDAEEAISREHALWLASRSSGSS